MRMCRAVCVLNDSYSRGVTSKIKSRSRNQVTMRVALLISGMLRDANEVYLHNMNVLHSSFSLSSSFDTFVFVSSSRYNGEDKRSSENVTFEMLHDIYKGVPQSQLDISDHRRMPGAWQVLRMHHMRRRMHRVWDMYTRSHSQDSHKYLMWLRPDVRIERAFDHERVSIKNDVLFDNRSRS